ncbi:Ig-like domain-containing protein [Neobacillus sp. GCM10023253]|uniref:multiheme c-type cytochrome n=1 Tax=Neobacillus sp. GCM10023253 TaxID=3252644 RepID=UPI00361F403E
MGRRGLLHNLKFQVLVILVICFQLLGSQQFSFISHVYGEGVVVPKITITSPKSGDISKETTITISGTVENFPAGVPIDLYDGIEKKETTNQITDNNWSITVTLTEGTHTITAKSVVDGVEISSDPINLTIDSLPSVSFGKPKNGEFTKFRSLAGSTDPMATVSLCIDCTLDAGGGGVTGTWVPVSADGTGRWEYEDSGLIDGPHEVFAKVIDETGNEGNISKVGFTLDTQRPIILPNILPMQNYTQVQLDSTIKVKISDLTPINNSKELIDNSIKVTRNGINVDGTNFFNDKTNEITFTPLSPLLPSTRYYVQANPNGIVDSAGNSAYPKVWSFTTVSDASAGHQNPHGSYAANVNTCANCHGTHKAQDPNLLSAKKPAEPGQKEEIIPVDTYCMACHDGTVAPQPENSQTTHVHIAAVGFDGKPNGSSCSTCHNPHSDWSVDNPNLAQGDITYTHNNTPHPDKPTGEINSKLQLCESCHETDSAEKLGDPGVKYRLFEYKKSNTALGIYEDFQLCLRCHNGDFQKKATNTPDIARYYNNLTEVTIAQYEKTNGQSSFANREISAAEKNFSGHIIKAQDGSPLAGHIPCAECHDTHGSNNVDQIKTQIGHENPTTFNLTSFDPNAIVKWDAGKQQSFCIACHNGSTAIYGVTGKAIYDEKTELSINPAIPDHNKKITETTKPCSECHSNSKSFVEAAHAPKK